MAFENKVVLITGASSGIGAVAATYFAKEGALLALIGRNAEKFRTVSENIAALGMENEPLIILADVSTDYERIINETIEKYQRLDILINNAGFSISGSIESTKIEDFDSMFATNVRGVLLLTQLAVPHLIETHGNIVNVSSVAGMRSFTNFLGYAMSKAALDQFTRCVALELAPKGVRVNAINPGVVDTPFFSVLGMNDDEIPAALDHMGKFHPMGRVGYSPEVVNAIAFLANQNTTFVTGVTLPIDGGLSIRSPFTE